MQMDRKKTEYEDLIHIKEMKIKRLEESIKRYKYDLEEKIIENAHIKRGLDRLKRTYEKRIGS